MVAEFSAGDPLYLVNDLQNSYLTFLYRFQILFDFLLRPVFIIY